MSTLFRSSKTQQLGDVRARPNFFIIGAPKCGTSSLTEYLRPHPSIFLSVKEPHYFDIDYAKCEKLTLSFYLSLFSKADPHIHKAIGEGSVSYLFSKVAVPEILKFNPDAKFIVMLRNPIDMIRSMHSFLYFQGVETVHDFEAAWRLEEGRRNGKSIPVTCWEPKQLFYSEWGKLGEQIERLFSTARRDNTKIILFDDFVANTRSIYEDLLAFLEVPADARQDFPVVNENREVRWPWLQQSLGFSINYFRQLRSVSRLSLGFGKGWFQRLLLMNSISAPRGPISPALCAELAGFFQADVAKLSRLLGRDLSHWVSNHSEPAGSPGNSQIHATPTNSAQVQ
jgi:hypothetical protein